MKLLKKIVKTILVLSLLMATLVFVLILHTPAGEYPLNRDLYQNIASSENYVKLADLPPDFVDILIANEDKLFYNHHGIDLKRTVGALVTNIEAGKYLTGGSTISQQLAKNLYYSGEKTFMRKVLELGTAFRLEYYFTKEQIIEMYINVIYYGADSYGIKAAAENYYRKSPMELTTAEIAQLVSLLPAPSVYNPIANPELAATRAEQALEMYQKDKAN